MIIALYSHHTVHMCTCAHVHLARLCAQLATEAYQHILCSLRLLLRCTHDLESVPAHPLHWAPADNACRFKIAGFPGAT